MVVVNVKGQEFYMDGYLKKNLDYVKERIVKRNEMFIGLVDGRVGTGKSTFIDQVAYYCSDGNFTLDDKAFTVRDFSSLLTEKKKGCLNNNVILDEAYELNKKRTATYANFKILKQLQRIRSKNLFIWLLLPSVYDLDKSILLNLANLFLRTYTKRDYGLKGRFMAYNRHQLKNLWLYNRQSLTYGQAPAFLGRFTGKFLSGDYDDYENRKNRILDKQDMDGNEYHDELKFQRNMSLYKLQKMGVKNTELARMFGKSVRQISRYLAEIKDTMEAPTKEEDK